MKEGLRLYQNNPTLRQLHERLTSESERKNPSDDVTKRLGEVVANEEPKQDQREIEEPAVAYGDDPLIIAQVF